MDKELSCGAIIFDQNSKILACHSTGKSFKNNTYDIPKGHIEEGETPWQTCVREVFEETGLDISNEDYIDCGQHEYVSYKDLHLFILKRDFTEEDVNNLKCTSYFEKDGKKMPECNGFVFINLDKIDDYYYKSLGAVVKKVLLQYWK